MNETAFPAIQVSEHIWWVGAADWTVRNFHGYLTGRGSSYNAFLIIDEHVTLIDSVKAPFTGEMLERVRSVIDPRKVEYIVSHHAEPDHSGGLTALMEATCARKLYASVAGAKTLAVYSQGKLSAETVKTGDKLELGAGSLEFVDTKMLHWPDSMVSFYDADGVIFSQDAFGMHLAGSNMWADEYDWSVLEYELRKYYANIINHQSPKVLTVLDELEKINWPAKMILPDHGPLWRQDPGRVMQLYREMAEQKPVKRAVVVYSTMWHATEKLAGALAEGIRSVGIPVQLLDLAVSDRSEVMTQVANSGLAAFGAPTMNNQMFPAMADALCYCKGLKPKNKIGFAFGAYGWSGEGAKQIAAALTEMGMEQPCELMQVKYMPNDTELKQMFANGAALGTALLGKCGN